MVRKIDKAIINAKTLAARTLSKGILKRKEAGDETLIIKIMLMVIAVVLVLLFRDTLLSMIKNLLTNNSTGLETKVQQMYNSAGNI